MNSVVAGGHLSGEVRIISSKSVLHRMLICAALCKMPTIIRGFCNSRDITATVNCLRSCAADTEIGIDIAKVMPYREYTRNPLLNCDESGSTLRFLLPVIAALGIGGVFTGGGRLPERPLSPLYELLCENGCRLSEQGKFPLTLSGKLSGKNFAINGQISSQFVSGLLLAAPLLKTECSVTVTGKFESKPYVDITREILRQFGVNIKQKGENRFEFGENCRYRSPGELSAEGDWSNAAFWLVAAVLSESFGLKIANLNLLSFQGDRVILDFLSEFGAEFTENGGTVEITALRDARPLLIDASNIPDLIPVLAVLACKATGVTKIYNAERLALKESNRLITTRDMIVSLGGRANVENGGLTINGNGRLKGGTVDSRNDHRIAMAAAVASFICDSPVTIKGAEAVKKSYPAFFDEFEARGMKVCHRYSETD